MERYKVKLWLFAGTCLFIAALSFAVDYSLSERYVLKSGLTVLQLLAAVTVVLSLSALFNLASHGYLAQKKKPVCEGMMVGRLYWMAGVFFSFVVILYGVGFLEKAGTLFMLFGGMLLGWSLQGPVVVLPLGFSCP